MLATRSAEEWAKVQPSCPWPRQTPIDYKTERTWYPVLCASERHAADWLIRAGYYPYWPHYTKHYHTRSGVQRPRKLSVIAGVVIIPMPVGRETFEHVRSVPKVRGFMMLNGVPQALWESQVGQIRLIEAALNMPVAVAPRPAWCVLGRLVRVKIVDDEGCDLRGPIVDIAERNRIVVEVPMLGSRRRMTVSLSQIEPI